MITDGAHEERSRGSGKRPWHNTLMVVALFLLPGVPLMVMNWSRGRAYSDQVEHYYQACLQFSAQWPRFDFKDYASATTPGYLLYLAAAHRFVTQDIRGLRLLGSLVTVGLLGHLAWLVGRRAGGWAGIALCLPMVASIYVFSSGIYLLPDNAGWWGVLAVTALALRGTVDGWTYAGGAALLAILVFVRQIHLWAAAMLWLAAWMGTAVNPDEEPTFHALFSDARRRIPRAALMVLLSVPAMLVILYFHRLWGGPTPPRYRDITQGGNAAIPATVLAVFGITGAFFLPMVWARVRQVLSDPAARRTILVAAAVGFLAGIIPVTSPSFPRRASGVWQIVSRLPVVAERSPAMVAMATWGAGMLALWTVALRGRTRWLFLGAWVAFITAQSASVVAWQRYYEPFAFMMLPLAASRIIAHEGRALPRWATAGPAGLALLSAAVTASGLR